MLALAGGLVPNPAAAAGEAALPCAQPQLLLIHGGSFLVDDPSFQPLTEPRAIAAGFALHYLSYPLGNMQAGLAAARREARRLRASHGADCLYGYGSSAGGTLTALLAGEGLLVAAVAKAPVSDLVGWQWPLVRYGANYYEGIDLDVRQRYRLSPLRRPQRRPLLVMQGRGDHVVPPAMNEEFAAKFKRVHLWLVPGGHTTERRRPYLISGAMRWLAAIAARRASKELERVDRCDRGAHGRARGDNSPSGTGRRCSSRRSSSSAATHARR